MNEILQDLGKSVCEHVKQFFENKENRKKFDEYYFKTYGKHYDWERKSHLTQLSIR